MRQRNLMEFVRSLNHIGACTKNDILLQMAECSFDVHAGDIFGTLTIGATLIMLHPGGLLDLEYLIQIMEKQQITSMTSVPSLFDRLFHFIEDHKSPDAMKTIKFVGSGGTVFLVNS